MGLVIRKTLTPLRVPVGDAVFLLNRVTFAMRADLRARLRDQRTGVVEDEAYTRELHKAILAGWEGLKFEDTGEAVPFGPCPACAPPAPAEPLAPVIPGPGATAPAKASGAPFCAGCGGTGDCREWALRTFPGDLWTMLALEATRVLSREEEAAKN